MALFLKLHQTKQLLKAVNPARAFRKLVKMLHMKKPKKYSEKTTRKDLDLDPKPYGQDQESEFAELFVGSIRRVRSEILSRRWKDLAVDLAPPTHTLMSYSFIPIMQRSLAVSALDVDELEEEYAAARNQSQTKDSGVFRHMSSDIVSDSYQVERSLFNKDLKGQNSNLSVTDDPMERAFAMSSLDLILGQENETGEDLNFNDINSSPKIGKPIQCDQRDRHDERAKVLRMIMNHELYGLYFY